MSIKIKTYQTPLYERLEKLEMEMSLKEISKQTGLSYEMLRSIKSNELNNYDTQDHNTINYKLDTLEKICKALKLELSIKIYDNNYYERTCEDEDNYDEIEYHDWEEREWEYRD